MLETHGRVVLPPELLEKALTTRGQGYRVVGAQRILQAQSDPFLGWIKDVTGEDGKPRDFYIRQFRDMKGSFTLEEMNAAETWATAGCAEGCSHGPIPKAPAAPSSSGIWAAAKPLTMRWRTGPEATRTRRKPTMQRWNKPSGRGGCPLNGVCEPGPYG